ncbi:hypothetical protein GLOIN_2v1878727 [Rhizophagus clarus]|uniref:Uncharacterized protein n=1 Tax=Rhizophagus clarus TaxID=94130 RepID=A0A8H3L3E9_9GLOM|nr:hypothetical protein GLOIN_2v1878727 [Rhizophagus clarus]
MSITLLYLAKGNTPANVFAVDIDSGKLLWKVSIPVKQPSAQLTAVSKISVNIKDELGSVELSPIDDISEHFDDGSNKLIKKNLHIIVEPPTERKEEKSDETVIESKTIHISTDEDLAIIIWTSAFQVDLEMVVDT